MFVRGMRRLFGGVRGVLGRGAAVPGGGVVGARVGGRVAFVPRGLEGGSGVGAGRVGRGVKSGGGEGAGVAGVPLTGLAGVVPACGVPLARRVRGGCLGREPRIGHPGAGRVVSRGRLRMGLGVVGVVRGLLMRAGVPLAAVVPVAVAVVVRRGVVAAVRLSLIHMSLVAAVLPARQGPEEWVGVEAAGGMAVVSGIPGVGVLVVHQLLSRLGSRTCTAGVRWGDPRVSSGRDCTRRYVRTTIFGGV